MKNNMPNHIAIIMDGNGRWAKNRHLPKKMGHKAGANALKALIKDIQKTSIKHVTVYAFSTENWKRSEEEVSALMALLKEYIKAYIKDNEKSNVKIDTIGNIYALEKDLVEDILYLQEISKKNTGLNLHIALNYGGRDEIIRAIKSMYRNLEEGKIDISDINEDIFSKFLDTKDYQDPELIIRTSGEFRTSNFLTWQSCYSEFYFCEKLWPDFTYEDLLEILNSYQKRERRFGGRIEE